MNLVGSGEALRRDLCIHIADPFELYSRDEQNIVKQLHSNF